MYIVVCVGSRRGIDSLSPTASFPLPWRLAPFKGCRHTTPTTSPFEPLMSVPKSPATCLWHRNLQAHAYGLQTPASSSHSSEGSGSDLASEDVVETCGIETPLSVQPCVIMLVDAQAPSSSSTKKPEACLYTCPYTCPYTCLYTCLHTCLQLTTHMSTRMATHAL